MFESIKQKFGSGFTFKTVLRWLVAIITIIVAIWGIRACTKGEIAKKALYRIGRDTTWYPVQLFGKEKNLVAFTNDLMSIIGTENHLRFEWVLANPNSLIDGLESGIYDFVLSTLRPNIVNEDRYEFSELIFELGPVLIVRQDSIASSLDDMKGKTIGIPSGNSPIFNAIRTAGANNFDLLVVTYNNMNLALNALASNQIDGVIMQALPAYSVTQGLYVGKLKVVTAPFSDEGLRFCALKSSKLTEIIDIIDTALDKMHTNGTYSALIAKWDLVDAETGFWHPPEEHKQ